MQMQDPGFGGVPTHLHDQGTLSKFLQIILFPREAASHMPGPVSDGKGKSAGGAPGRA